MSAPGATRARLGLSLLVVAVFGLTLSHDYVWDDRALIVDNAALEGVAGIYVALFDGLFSHTRDAPETPLYHRPWVRLSFMVDRALGPAVAHLQSLTWHLAAVWAVHALLLRLGASARAAVLGAAVLAIHPVQVEAVAWVSARNDPMVLLGIVATCLAVLQRRRRLGVGALCFVAALLAVGSKESGVLAPLVASAMVAVAPDPPPRGVWLRRVLLAVLAVVAMLSLRAVAGVGWPQSADVPHLAAAVVPYVSWALAALSWPMDRVPGNHLAWPEPVPVAAWLTGLGVLAGLAVFGGRRGRLGVALAVLLAGVALPGVAAVGLLGDRFLTLPLLGVAVAVSGLVDSARPSRRGVVEGAVWVVVFALGVTAATTVPSWRDDPTLWTHAAAVHPNPHVHGTAGRVFLDAGTQADTARAVTHYDAAVAHAPPPFMPACWNVVRAHLALGDAVGAVEAGTTARAQGCPADPELMGPWALAHALSGDLATGAHIGSAVEPDPTGQGKLAVLVHAAATLDQATLDAAAPDRGSRAQLASAVLQVLDASGRADLIAERLGVWVEGGAL